MHMKTALETLQPAIIQPDSLIIGSRETVPAPLELVAAQAGQAALTTFESLAYRPGPEGRGTTYWTNPRVGYDADPQSGS
jgi:hypothetical protein